MISDEKPIQPICESLLGEDDQGPYLKGGRCRACGFVTLGERNICPECWSNNTMQLWPIGRTGNLYTWTVIHQVPAGYQAPFAVGYVDVEDGVRIFAHIDRDSAALKPDAPLKLTAAILRRDEHGAGFVGPRYVVRSS
jgi:uncharacterized OB-fold protein